MKANPEIIKTFDKCIAEVQKELDYWVDYRANKSFLKEQKERAEYHVLRLNRELESIVKIKEEYLA